MQRKSLKESVLVVSLAFVPIFFYWCLKEFFHPRPFWVYYDHIETLYYYASIELSEGFMPTNIDNPGSLVQLIGVLFVKLIGSNPENYPLFQRTAHITILVFSFVASVILVRLTLADVNRYLSVIFVWAYFSFSVSLAYFQVWGPEPFFYIIGLLFIASLFWMLETPDHSSNFKILVTGGCIGLLLSVKFIFLAWLPGFFLLLLLANFHRGIYRTVKGLAAGFIGIVSAFVTVTFPMREGYPYMFEWIARLMFREGPYGSGNKVAPSIEVAIGNWQAFVLSNELWLFLFAVLFALVVFNLLKHNRKIEARKFVLLLVFLSSTLVLSFVSIIRSYHGRYMLPVGLCGIIVFVLFAQSLKNSTRTSLNIIVCFLAFALLAKSMSNDFNTHKMKIHESITLKTLVDEKIQRLASLYSIKEPVIIYGWRIPTMSFSLRHMASREEHQARIDRLFPTEGHHVPWTDPHTFRIPGGAEKWDFAVIRNEYLNQLPISRFAIIDKIDNYLILRPSN